MATLQSVRLGPQGRPQNGTSLRLEVKCSRIWMLGRAITARFDFNIRLEMGTVAITLPTSLGERLLVHVEELRAWTEGLSHMKCDVYIHKRLYAE